MKKYLDTSTLVMYQSGNNKGHFDWINNIGKELYFEYDDISGIIKILEIQGENAKRMTIQEYLRGHPISEFDIFE